MEIIINFIKEINICYVILNLLLLIDLKFYLQTKSIQKRYKNLILLMALTVSIIFFSYGNGLIISIFDLKYLSVKIYLLSVIATNIITLYTFNKELPLGYSTLNYTLFILIMIIFGSIVAIILGNKFEQFYIMDISNAITLIDLSLVSFFLYLIIFSLIYIGDYIFRQHSLQERKEMVKSKNIELAKKRKSHQEHWQTKILAWKEKKQAKKHETINQKPILSEEELLNYQDKQRFYINGVDCSIIFEDSKKENIIKNYHILLNDMEAKLVNGYTLKENKLLRSICMKLRISNLNYIDLDNTSLLNRISPEEYNFLKSIMESH